MASSSGEQQSESRKGLTQAPPDSNASTVSACPYLCQHQVTANACTHMEPGVGVSVNVDIDIAYDKHANICEPQQYLMGRCW